MTRRTWHIAVSNAPARPVAGEEPVAPIRVLEGGPFGPPLLGLGTAGARALARELLAAADFVEATTGEPLCDNSQTSTRPEASDPRKTPKTAL